MGVLALLEAEARSHCTVCKRTLFSHTVVAVYDAGFPGVHLDALGLPVKSPGVGLVFLHSEE